MFHHFPQRREPAITRPYDTEAATPAPTRPSLQAAFVLSVLFPVLSVWVITDPKRTDGPREGPRPHSRPRHPAHMMDMAVKE